MTTPVNTAPKTIIRIYPETIIGYSGTPPALPAPSGGPGLLSRIWRWLWLPVLLAAIPAFLLGPLVSGIACLGLGVLLLVLALLPTRRKLEPRVELDAYFDDQGLHLPAQAAPDNERFIPYEDITRILTLDLPAQAGKLVVWWRQYQIHTRRPLANPHLQINTRRSLDTVVSVLNRLKRLPATRHIDIPPPTETAPPAGAKAAREIRLR